MILLKGGRERRRGTGGFHCLCDSKEKGSLPVTDAQKRKLLSDPIFDQKDLFAPASIEAAREAARDFSLYRGAQSRPSTSSGSNHRRQFNQSNHRGRHNVSPKSTQQRSPASHPPSVRFQQKRKSSESPRKRGSFRK